MSARLPNKPKDIFLHNYGESFGLILFYLNCLPHTKAVAFLNRVVRSDPEKTTLLKGRQLPKMFKNPGAGH